MADAPDLGSGTERREGSSPFSCTSCGSGADWMRHSGLKNRYVRYIVGSNPTYRTMGS